MCTSRAPKPTPVQEKKPVFMRNPFLDPGPAARNVVGRNSLRIDLGSTTPTASPGTAPGTTPTDPGVLPGLPGTPPGGGPGGWDGSEGFIRGLAGLAIRR